MKIRLDQLLLQQEHATDLKDAQAMIGAGSVFVNEVCADKPGTIFDDSVTLRVKEKCRYVSRGGLKLEKALSSFNLITTDRICVDIGASSGGFTDCLLQHHAAKVYAVDVAYGQFSWKLRQDKRVIVIERFNARKISKNEIPDLIDLAVLDASFISLKTLIPPLLPLFDDLINIVALIKPQFELPREYIGKGGVVRDKEHHQMAIDGVSHFAAQHNLNVEGVVDSPILGPKGNKEFLIFLSS